MLSNTPCSTAPNEAERAAPNEATIVGVSGCRAGGRGRAEDEPADRDGLGLRGLAALDPGHPRLPPGSGNDSAPAPLRRRTKPTHRAKRSHDCRDSAACDGSAGRPGRADHAAPRAARVGTERSQLCRVDRSPGWPGMGGHPNAGEGRRTNPCGSRIEPSSRRAERSHDDRDRDEFAARRAHEAPPRSPSSRPPRGRSRGASALRGSPACRPALTRPGGDFQNTRNVSAGRGATVPVEVSARGASLTCRSTNITARRASTASRP